VPLEPERIDCRRCRSFFITHEPDFPYGCRSFGMKTRALPSLEVLRASGVPCRAFDPRPPRPSAPKKPEEGGTYA